MPVVINMNILYVQLVCCINLRRFSRCIRCYSNIRQYIALIIKPYIFKAEA